MSGYSNWHICSLEMSWRVLAVLETVYTAENQVLRMNIEVLAVPETVYIAEMDVYWMEIG